MIVARATRNKVKLYTRRQIHKADKAQRLEAKAEAKTRRASEKAMERSGRPVDAALRGTEQ